MSMGEKQWHGPVVSHCWAMIDIHSVCSTSLYHKETEEALIPLKVKAALTLPSRTEDGALWEHLIAAWSGTCCVGVCRSQSHESNLWKWSGRLCWWLTCVFPLLAGADPASSQSWEGIVYWREACSLTGHAKKHGGLACCPTDTWGTAEGHPLSGPVATRLVWEGLGFTVRGKERHVG